jgi:hypothetical protein
MFLSLDTSFSFLIDRSSIYRVAAIAPYRGAVARQELISSPHFRTVFIKAHDRVDKHTRNSRSSVALYGYKKSPSGLGRFKPSPPNKSERSYMGFNYADKYGIYEIPFIDEPM